VPELRAGTAKEGELVDLRLNNSIDQESKSRHQQDE
jgi:hypothetical protein